MDVIKFALHQVLYVYLITYVLNLNYFYLYTNNCDIIKFFLGLHGGKIYNILFVETRRKFTYLYNCDTAAVLQDIFARSWLGIYNIFSASFKFT